MKRQIVDVLAPIYREYLKFCEEREIKLDFDLAEPNLMIDWSQELEDLVWALVNDGMEKLRAGDSFLVGSGSRSGRPFLFFKNSGAVLSRDECEARSTAMVRYKSRYGYGTLVEVDL